MGANEIIHQSLRLKIMSALHADRRGDPWDFSRLRQVTGATDGNLGSHLQTLEQAGYITITKDFVGRKPRTQVMLTKEGERAFRDHVDYLRDILDAAKD